MIVGRAVVTMVISRAPRNVTKVREIVMMVIQGGKGVSPSWFSSFTSLVMAVLVFVAGTMMSISELVDKVPFSLFTRRMSAIVSKCLVLSGMY